MPRAAAVLFVFALATVTLLPLQIIAVGLDWPIKRSIPTLFHRLICRLFGIRIRVGGERSPHTPLIIVANHTSWLDISVLSAVCPVIFVAKSEVASWPLFGLLAKLQRSVFVDRVRRHKTRDANAEIAQRLAGGDPVLLFGEGTSSDGNRVLPFRTALIGAAHDALALTARDRIYLQPLSLAYTALQGLPLGRQHRPLVAWYGAFSLLPHLLNLARQGAIDVTVTFGEPIAFDATSDRKVAARNLEAIVRRLTTTALRGGASSVAAA
jgi:1-acyl-sn-glycerol-3-phosphate acyltransferase